MGLIDAHVHVGSWLHADFLGRACDLAETLATLTAAGVDGAALMPSDRCENEALLEGMKRQLAAGFAGPLWFFPWIRPDDDLDFVRARRADVTGLKIHPSLARRRVTDEAYRPALELAEELGLVVLVHCGRWAEIAGFAHACEAAARHPGARFLFAHAGGDTPPNATGAAREVEERGLTNVWFEFSGLREYWVIERNVARLGAGRYLLGSDFPLAHPLMYVGAVRGMALTEEDRRRILGDNARALFGRPLGMTCVLVTGAGGPLGANVTRSLRAAPEPLRIVGTDANRWHLPLSLADRTLLIPPAREREGYARALASLVVEGVEVVLPTHPVEVRQVASLVEEGRLPGARTALPLLAVLERADDKVATQRALAAAGVPVPRTILLERPEDLAQAFETLGTPVWVRGTGAPGLGIGGAALPCRDLAVARAWVEHHRGWGKMAASELLPGRNLTWMCAWAGGRLLAAAARERLEYVLPHVSPSGITGAPAVTRTVRRADVAAIGEQAVRALCGPIAPQGVFFVDLKEDAAGGPRVTEINAGRCGTTVHFYTEAGFNFPWLLVCLALGRDLGWLPASPQDVVPEGLYWVRTLDCGPVLVRGDAAFDAYERRP